MKKIFTLGAILSLTACGGGFEKTNQQFMGDFENGNYESAANMMEKATVSKDEPTEVYLGGLQCGTGYLWANNIEGRNICFGAVERTLKGEIEDDSSYKRKDYERIAYKTYEGIGEIVEGSEYARNTLIAAYEEQARNLTENAKDDEEVKEARKKMEEDSKKAQEAGKGINTSAAISEATELFNKDAEVKAYRDYANPYTTYIHALYSAYNGEKNNLNLYYNRLRNWSPDNTFLKSDVAAINAGKKNVWVFFENGKIGEIKERSLTPKILQTFGVKMTVPDVAQGSPAMSHLHVVAGDQAEDTQFFANYDSVVKTDMNKYATGNIIKSVAFEVGKITAATLAKIAADEAAKKNSNSPFLRLAGDAAIVGIMSVEYPWDLRSWQSLPHEIQTARIDMPSDRKLVINGEYTVEIPEDVNNAAVFVRVPSVTAKPAILVGKLN